jgi:hypothetical protein
MLPNNVFVQALACANSKEETAGHGFSRCGCGLSNECRMDSHDRACNTCSKAQLSGCLGDRPDDYPHKRTVPLLVYPWMKMI